MVGFEPTGGYYWCHQPLGHIPIKPASRRLKLAQSLAASRAEIHRNRALLPIAELGILGGLSDENLVDEKLAYLFPVVFAELAHANHLRSYAKERAKLVIRRRIEIGSLCTVEGASYISPVAI